jgi:hypothetical protein
VTIIEEKEQILKSSPVVDEEENSYEILIPWEQELKLLEDWLCHLDTEVELSQDTFMQSEGES